MAFAFSRGALPDVAEDLTVVAQDAISVPTAPAENGDDPWIFDSATLPVRTDLWPRSIRLSLIGVLSLASWGLVLGAGYALRAAMA